MQVKALRRSETGRNFLNATRLVGPENPRVAIELSSPTIRIELGRIRRLLRGGAGAIGMLENTYARYSDSAGALAGTERRTARVGGVT